MLNHGGRFVSSTICLGDSLMVRGISAFISLGALFGLLPSLSVFTSGDLLDNLQKAGFEIAYKSQPNEKSVFFIVAKKP